MIAVLRKIVIISILFAIILFIQSIQVETTAIVSPKTLAVLGFLILASFTLGEILSMLGLPRVIGYLLIGVVFGPYTTYIFNTDLLKVFDFGVIKDLKLVDTITLSIIALTAGMELKLGELKKSVKPISLLLLFKTLFIFVMIPLTVYGLSSFIPFLQNASWQTILVSGLLLSVIAMGTSIELTLVVADEAEAKGRFIDIILSTAIVKDVIVILLLALCLTLSISLLNPAAGMELSVFTDLGLELLFSVALGGLFGVLVLLYLKYLAKELLLFIFAFIVVGSAVSSSLHLETLIVFITAGFVIRNYSELSEKFHHPLNKLSLPIFITFFTVAGASINLLSIQATIIIGVVIALIRAVAMFFSVRLAAKITREPKEFFDYGWMGFLSIGGLMLGLGIIIEDKIPGIGTELKTIITSLVALNLFLGPILLKFALGKVKKPEVVEDKQTDVIDAEEGKGLPKDNITAKFKEPDLSDHSLNKSLYQIVLKMNNILHDFDKNFILERSEESLELIISITEKYTDDYFAIKSNYLGDNISLDELRNGIFEIKRNLDKWYLDFCEERRSIERNVLKLEPLIKDLFFSLTDLTDSLSKEVVVNLEKEKYEFNNSDSSKVKLRKYIYQLKFKFNKLFNKEYVLTRKIDYQNLAKYFLVGESYNEILETVNLVGLERLTTLKKIRNLFNDYSNYLNELAKLTLADEPSPELISTIQSKYEELHKVFVNELNIYRSEITNTTEEISSRLTFALANPFNRLLEILHIAGTPEFSSGKYKYSKIFSESEIKKDKALETVRFWINYYLGFIGLFEKEIYINKLETELNLIVDNSLIHLSEEISGNLRLAGRELSSKLESFKKIVEDTSEHSSEEYLNLLSSKKDELLNKTLSKFISNLEEIRRGKKMNSLIENMIHDFSIIARSFPESVSLLEERDFKFLHRTPEFKNLHKVPIKNILSSFLEKKLPRSMGEINELLLNHLNLTLIELKNLFTVIRFHITSTENEVQKNPENCRQLVVDFTETLLSKIEYRLKELNSQIDLLEESINQKVLDKVAENVKSINNILIESSSLEANFYLESELKKSLLFNFMGELVKKGKYSLRKFYVMVRRNYSKYLQNEINDLLIQLRIKNRKTNRWSASPLQLNEEKLNKLPFIYRKLFDGSVLESNDFLINDDELNSQIEEAIENFNKNVNSATLLIGGPGSGKSTFINSIKNNFLSDKTYSEYKFMETISTTERLLEVLSKILGYKRALTIDEIILTLNDPSNQRIIILQGIEKLYLRKVGGYEAIKSFGYIVSATSRNTFWLCTSGKYAWNIFANNFSLRNNFMNVIAVDRLRNKSIRLIIENRHNATGYGLKFIQDDLTILRNKIFGRKADINEQVELSERFFHKLEEYSEGNISSAIFYWLHSIKEIQENVLIIGSPRRIDSQFLTDLNDFYFLTISEVLNHGLMTANEHAEIFNVSLEKSTATLEYLESINILNKNKYDISPSNYFINKFLFKLVEKELVKRNMV